VGGNKGVRQRFTAALRQAIGLLRDEHIDAAEAAFERLLLQHPDQPDCLHFLGVLRHLQGRRDESLALIERALQQIPQHASAWNNLGNVLLECGRLEEAERAYARAIDVAGNTDAAADAMANLGVLSRRLGRAIEAEGWCRRAIEASPDTASPWYNLSLALMDQRRVHEALLANARAVTLGPRDVQGRTQVIRALVLLDEREQAAQLYQDWLTEEPDNPVVQHQLAACTGNAPPARASDAYVQQVFDAFATSFDAKLESLDYRAPQLVTQALSAAVHAADGSLVVADLGCGTGLCGPLLRPWARRLVGCDLSIGMLRMARARHVYDQLHQAELVYYLQTQPATFDVLVSADTLCYFGALDDAMRAAGTALRPGGWWVFTVEALADTDQRPFCLQPNGRYAHHADHIRAALSAANLKLHDLQCRDLRSESGLPVSGWLVTARRPSDARSEDG
jgi:predicted TPR repeat methyltransferase